MFQPSNLLGFRLLRHTLRVPTLSNNATLFPLVLIQCAFTLNKDYESKRSPKYGGVIRYETAELIRGLVDELTSVLRQEDILVLTPYRAQRLLIKTILKNANLKKVTVSTVHRAQGSERDTIIFDPVETANSFLNNNDLGPRLMNVALSRAKSRLILIVSEENLRNPVLRQIETLME
ncbi:MAG TPA: C-terminal helicase domain-containing protein, partial [Anaerolineales bacterium]|nr:C-terminal helicase domain-containing protein [Anaerolineales bacterium]